MEEKIKFLKKYRQNVEIIENSILLKENLNSIPEQWRSILIITDKKKRVIETIKLWERTVPKDFRTTISYLKNNLLEVEMIKVNEEFTVLYSIKTSKAKIGYYEGKFYKNNFCNENLKKVWNKIPNSIKNFYENLHDGFYYYPGVNMGLVPLEDVILFSDYEWGILDDLEEPLEINLDTTFGFFQSGMGGYAAIDVNNCDCDRAVLWFSADQPTYNKNFWNIVDEWTTIGCED